MTRTYIHTLTHTQVVHLKAAILSVTMLRSYNYPTQGSQEKTFFFLPKTNYTRVYNSHRIRGNRLPVYICPVRHTHTHTQKHLQL